MRHRLVGGRRRLNAAGRVGLIMLLSIVILNRREIRTNETLVSCVKTSKINKLTRVEKKNKIKKVIGS